MTACSKAVTIGNAKSCPSQLPVSFEEKSNRRLGNRGNPFGLEKVGELICRHDYSL